MKHALVALLVPVQFQLAHFTGVDQFGQPCSLTVTAKSGEVMDSFTFETGGFSYEVVTGARVKTSTPGHLSLTANLMFGSNTLSRMSYVPARGPVHPSKLTKTQFEISYRADEPTAVKMTKTSKGAFSERTSFESCTRLQK